MSDVIGNAVLLSVRNFFSLDNYLQVLRIVFNATFFEVGSVTFHNLKSLELQEFTFTLAVPTKFSPTFPKHSQKSFRSYVNYDGAPQPLTGHVLASLKLIVTLCHLVLSS